MAARKIMGDFGVLWNHTSNLRNKVSKTTISKPITMLGTVRILEGATKTKNNFNWSGLISHLDGREDQYE